MNHRKSNAGRGASETDILTAELDLVVRSVSRRYAQFVLRYDALMRLDQAFDPIPTPAIFFWQHSSEGVERRDGVMLHFCAKCGAWGAYGYGVKLRGGQLGLWYCAAHRSEGKSQ